MGRWEDELEIDDSDLITIAHPPHPSLPSGSLPPLQPCSKFSSRSQSIPLDPPPKHQTPSLAPEREEERPPRTTALPRLIPGPAGAVQATMRRQVAAATATAQPRKDSNLEQDTGNQTVEGDEEDADFTLNPWLCTLDFLGRRQDGVDGGSVIPSHISSIKTHHQGNGRVPQAVGIVKSCRPNGLGDLFVTLKDPTGTIGASIHRKVIMESNFGADLLVGSVLILKQVAIFSPVRSTSYLNVTLNNVVKLISKDSGPPRCQSYPAFAATSVQCGASGKQIEVGLGEAERVSLARQGAERVSDAESEREPMDVELRAAERIPLGREGATSVSSTESRRDQVTIVLGAPERASLSRQGAERVSDAKSQREPMDVGLGAAERVPLGREGAANVFSAESQMKHLASGLEAPLARQGVESVSCGEPSREHMILGLGEAEGAPLALQRTKFVTDEELIKATNHKRMAMDDGKKCGPVGGSRISSIPATTIAVAEPEIKVTEPKRLISKISVGQWTDEQLSELFSDYQDDAFI